MHYLNIGLRRAKNCRVSEVNTWQSSRQRWRGRKEIYEESPVLSCAMTKSLREFEKDSEALRLFEYSIESSFPCSLDSLLIVRNTMGEEPAFLPLLSQQGISLYDLKEGKLGSEATHPLVPCSQETTLCLLTSHSLMSISGHAVSCLDILTSKCSNKQATIRPRRASELCALRIYLRRLWREIRREI